MKPASFDDYDEFSSDVTDQAIEFLIKKRTLTRKGAEDTIPSSLWTLAVNRGWQPPELPVISKERS